MVPVLNSLVAYKGKLTLTEETRKLLYTILTEIGFVSTVTEEPDIYKITVNESSTNIHQRIVAVKAIINILGLSLPLAKDIIYDQHSTTCTAAQVEVLREKLKPLGYNVNVKL